jgi:hypothetical protein
MSHINVENFGAVIDATNDLKQQFREMKIQNKTPNDFGLMVKTCPDILNTLLVTSRNKSRLTIDKTLVLNYSCQTVDTSKIYWDMNVNNRNLSILRNEIEQRLGDIREYDGRFMYREVEKDVIISILRKLSIPYENTKFDIQSICDFLESSSRLDLWDIVIATGNKDESIKKFIFGGKQLDSVKRSFEYRAHENEAFLRISGNNNRLVDPGIFDAGLDDNTIKEIKKTVEPGKIPTAKDYLKRRKFPILVIYPIDLKVDKEESEKNRVKNQLNGEFLMGIGIGFPYNGQGISITYKLNVRRQQELEKEREMMEDQDDE